MDKGYLYILNIFQLSNIQLDLQNACRKHQKVFTLNNINAISLDNFFWQLFPKIQQQHKKE